MVIQARYTLESRTSVTAASSRTTTACRTYHNGMAHHATSSDTPATAPSSLPWSSQTILSSSSGSPCAALCPWLVLVKPSSERPRPHSSQLFQNCDTLALNDIFKHFLILLADVYFEVWFNWSKSQWAIIYIPITKDSIEMKRLVQFWVSVLLYCSLSFQPYTFF